MNEAHLIVGLGNPGAKYEGTRHNVGFLALSRLADKWGGGWSEEKKFKAQMSQVMVNGKSIHLCRPQTYMNLSGESVSAVCSYYKIATQKLLVIVDDTELSIGQLRMRVSGSSGGHNGLGSVEQHLATPNYLRLRIGVGKPQSGIELAGHVLGKLSSAELMNVVQVLDLVLLQCECWLQHGAGQAMNKFNGKLDFPQKTIDKDIE